MTKKEAEEGAEVRKGDRKGNGRGVREDGRRA